jgi:surface antigen
VMMSSTAHDALERVPSHNVSRWDNPNSGNHGSFTPMRTYRTSRGQPCREFQQKVTVGGRTEDAYGTACRQSDGSWRIINN